MGEEELVDTAARSSSPKATCQFALGRRGLLAHGRAGAVEQVDGVVGEDGAQLSHQSHVLPQRARWAAYILEAATPSGRLGSK